MKMNSYEKFIKCVDEPEKVRTVYCFLEREMAMGKKQGRALRNCPVGNFSKGASLQWSKKLVFSDAFYSLRS